MSVKAVPRRTFEAFWDTIGFSLNSIVFFFAGAALALAAYTCLRAAAAAAAAAAAKLLYSDMLAIRRRWPLMLTVPC